MVLSLLKTEARGDTFCFHMMTMVGQSLSLGATGRLVTYLAPYFPYPAWEATLMHLTNISQVEYLLVPHQIFRAIPAPVTTLNAEEVT